MPPWEGRIYGMFGLEIWPVQTADIYLYSLDIVTVITLFYIACNSRKMSAGLVFLAGIRTAAQAYITYSGHRTEVTMVYVIADQVLFKFVVFAALRVFYMRSQRLGAFLAGAYFAFVAYYTWHEVLTDELRLLDNGIAVVGFMFASILSHRSSHLTTSICLSTQVLVSALALTHPDDTINPVLCRATLDLSILCAALCQAWSPRDDTGGEEEEDSDEDIELQSASVVAGITCSPLSESEMDIRLRSAAPTPSAPMTVNYQ